MAPVAAGKHEDDEPRRAVHRFFTLVLRQKYEEAYGQFSSSVKREVSFSRFVEGARDVKYLKIHKITLTDREKNLVKLRMQALIHLVYRGSLYEAVYEGKVSLYREKGRWTVMTVDLKAVSQKSLNRKAPPKQLQKLDFGT
jgi:hypothetical protein